jgi:TMEM175 potassium channel family protein
MSKGRLEAFSDGVIAIVITIMVLELRAPTGGVALGDLAPLIPVFFSYVLSFVNVGIYWNNHHHMLHSADRISGQVLWANLHLLFWLSLFPFVTAWMGENHFETLPVAVYGVVSLMSGVAYYVLARALVRCHGEGSAFATALGGDLKGKSSVLIYAAAIGLCFVSAWIGLALYVVVAGMWFVPDRRFEGV